MPAQNRATNTRCAHTPLCIAVRLKYPFFEPKSGALFTPGAEDDDDDGKEEDSIDDDDDDQDKE